MPQFGNPDSPAPRIFSDDILQLSLHSDSGPQKRKPSAAKSPGPRRRKITIHRHFISALAGSNGTSCRREYPSGPGGPDSQARRNRGRGTAIDGGCAAPAPGSEISRGPSRLQFFRRGAAFVRNRKHGTKRYCNRRNRPHFLPFPVFFPSNSGIKLTNCG